MAFKITLDKEALAALFPEGSEARVELSRAVIADLVKRLSLKETKYLDAHLRQQVEIAAREALNQAGIFEGTFGRVLLSANQKAAIKYAAQEALAAEISPAKLREQIKEVDSNFEARVSMAVSRVIDIAAGKQVREIVREELRRLAGA